MNECDLVIEKIFVVLSMDTERPNTDLGYFLSSSDRAYRNEAIRQIFQGLKRDNQNALLEFTLKMLCSQVDRNVTSLELLPKGGVING